MASSATVGSAVIKLSFDGKGVTAELDGVSKLIEKSGDTSGSKFGNAWTVAVGNIMSKGITKITSTISNQISDAVVRADTLERFPKVMQQMGYSSDIASGAIEKLMKGVEQVPTPLNEVVSGTQRLVSVTKDVNKASDWVLAISDAMLSNGASANRASDAMEQFFQVVSRGKPQGQDWLTIMEVAPGVMNELAQSLGYTSATLGGDMYTALQKGELSMEDFMAAMVQMDKEGTGSLGALSEVAKTATGGIETAVVTMRQSISNAIVEIIQTIGAENITAIIGNIKDALVGLVGVIKNVVTFIGENWSWMGPIIGVLGTVAGIIVAITTAINIWQSVQTAFNAVQLAFNAILNANPIFLLATVIAGVVAALTWFFTQTETGKQIIQGFGEIIGKVFGAIGDFVSGVWTTITEGAQNVWNFITGLFSGLANFFGSIFSGAWEAVKNVFSTGGKIFMGIVDGITQAFRTIVNAIITGINHVVALPFNAINGFLGFLKSIDILGIKPFDWVGTIDVPQIPLLAEGGVAGGATEAIIGEAGTEVVLPLENNTDNWAGLLASTLMEQMEAESIGGREIVVNMTNEINNQLDAEEIGRVMIQSIRRAA
jgi:tape measure domain-containing protein